MSFTCPNSARVSLPNILRTIFSPELEPHIRIPPTRPFNRPPLRLNTARNHSTITTVPLGSIPTATAHKPHSPAPIEYEPSTTLENSKVEKQDLIDQLSAGDTRPKSPPSKSRRATSEPMTKSEKPSTDRDAKPKKTTSKKQSNEPPKPRKREAWEVQKHALKKKFPAGWAPPKKLSPDAMEGIRHLHSADPDKFNTAVLAQEFKVSPEAIRRILRSKWRPSATEAEKRRERWEKRHERIWSHMAELGLRPKRDNGIDAAAVLKFKSNATENLP
ncbi:hypothetical protein BDW69DRAFT_157543 [Aspergillus filifer]